MMSCVSTDLANSFNGRPCLNQLLHTQPLATFGSLYKQRGQRLAPEL